MSSDKSIVLFPFAPCFCFVVNWVSPDSGADPDSRNNCVNISDTLVGQGGLYSRVGYTYHVITILTDQAAHLRRTFGH